MPQVDFYTIKEVNYQDCLMFACRLTEKVFSSGVKVYLHVNDAQTAEELDNLMWEFKPESFIPHAIHGVLDNEEEKETPVIIGYKEKPSHINELLINLSSNIPSFHDNFSRIAEIVINNDDAKVISRQHWGEYKAVNYELKHHQL